MFTAFAYWFLFLAHATHAVIPFGLLRLCFARFLCLLAAWQVYRLCTQCLPRDWVLQEWCRQCIVAQLQCIQSMILHDLSDCCHSRETRTLRVDVEASLDLTSLLGATIQGMPPPGWFTESFSFMPSKSHFSSKKLNRQLIHRQRNRNWFVALYSLYMWANLEQLLFFLNYSALERRVDSAGSGHVKPGMAPMMGMMPPGRWERNGIPPSNGTS